MPVTLSRTFPPLKWHGGKHYLAPKIIALMPEHTHYVEPYAGGLSVLLAKDPEGVSEVANDLNGDLTNFWRVLQQDESFGRFRRTLEAVPFSEAEWRDARSAPAGDRAGPWRPAGDDERTRSGRGSSCRSRRSHLVARVHARHAG